MEVGRGIVEAEGEGKKTILLECHHERTDRSFHDERTTLGP
jgi:hypothetical protein